MGLFDKLKSAIGGLDKASEESAALAGIRELKNKLGMDIKHSEMDSGQQARATLQEPEDDLKDTPMIPEDYASEDKEEDYAEEETGVVGDEEEDEEAAENRAKPIFIIYLKRYEVPLTSSSILSNGDDLDRYKLQCLLMRDKAEEPDLAHCFFGEPVSQLMSKALTELESWKAETEEDIVPVIDVVVDARAYNCDIDEETFRKVVYYIVNEYGQEAVEVKGNIPYRDSLIRVIEEAKGKKAVKDFLAYPDWTGLDDDDDNWVSRMIAKHDIRL